MSQDTTKNPRLLLIEDDPQLGPLVERALRGAYDVLRVTDGQRGLEIGQTQDFDVLVIDRRLPTLSGIDVIETLRRKRVTTPILMLTALGSVQDRVSGLDAGANDYLVKPFEFEELLARLRSLVRVYTGEGALTTIGLWEFYPESRAVYSPYNGRIILTDRETDLLQLLAANPGRTFTRDQILRAVFHSDEHPGTVDTYVHYLRRKTDKDMITTVRGNGYRLGTP